MPEQRRISKETLEVINQARQDADELTDRLQLPALRGSPTVWQVIGEIADVVDDLSRRSDSGEDPRE